MVEKCTFDYGGDEFYKNLDNFILACLKDYSKNGSLTKTQMKKWFSDNVNRVIADADTFVEHEI